MITQVLWCELDKNRNLMWSQRWKACLILIFSANTNCESMVHRSLRSEEYSARGVAKVTTGIIYSLSFFGWLRSPHPPAACVIQAFMATLLFYPSMSARPVIESQKCATLAWGSSLEARARLRHISSRSGAGASWGLGPSRHQTRTFSMQIYVRFVSIFPRELFTEFFSWFFSPRRRFGHCRWGAVLDTWKNLTKTDAMLKNSSCQRKRMQVAMSYLLGVHAGCVAQFACSYEHKLSVDRGFTIQHGCQRPSLWVWLYRVWFLRQCIQCALWLIFIQAKIFVIPFSWDATWESGSRSSKRDQRPETREPTFSSLLFFFSSYTEKLFTSRKVDRFSSQSRCLVGDIGCRLRSQMCYVCDISVWSKRARGSVGLLRYMVVWGYNADVNSRRCVGGFVRVRGRCLSAFGCSALCCWEQTFSVVLLALASHDSGELSPLFAVLCSSCTDVYRRALAWCLWHLVLKKCRFSNFVFPMATEGKRGRPQWEQGRPLFENAYHHKQQGFLAKHACVMATPSETLWSGFTVPGIWSSTLLGESLSDPNSELFNRPGHGMLELSHSVSATHNILNDDENVGAPSLVNAWNELYGKYQIASATEGLRANDALGDVQSFAEFVRTLQEDWSRWSVVFGCLGTGVVVLSAVLSGCAVLKDDYGVKCRPGSHSKVLLIPHPSRQPKSKLEATITARKNARQGQSRNQQGRRWVLKLRASNPDRILVSVLTSSILLQPISKSLKVANGEVDVIQVLDAVAKVRVVNRNKNLPANQDMLHLTTVETLSKTLFRTWSSPCSQSAATSREFDAGGHCAPLNCPRQKKTHTCCHTFEIHARACRHTCFLSLAHTYTCLLLGHLLLQKCPRWDRRASVRLPRKSNFWMRGFGFSAFRLLWLFWLLWIFWLFVWSGLSAFRPVDRQRNVAVIYPSAFPGAIRNRAAIVWNRTFFFTGNLEAVFLQFCGCALLTAKVRPHAFVWKRERFRTSEVRHCWSCAFARFRTISGWITLGTRSYEGVREHTNLHENVRSQIWQTRAAQAYQSRMNSFVFVRFRSSEVRSVMAYKSGFYNIYLIIGAFYYEFSLCRIVLISFGNCSY